MKQQSLGAALIRSQQALRQNFYFKAVAAAGGQGPNVQLDASSKALVAKMFDSAKKRIAKIIKLDVGTREVSVVLGTLGTQEGRPHGSKATCILSDACWPMTIPEGVQLSTNPFHREWARLTKWAVEEELTVEIRAKLHGHIAKTVFHLVVTAR